MSEYHELTKLLQTSPSFDDTIREWLGEKTKKLRFCETESVVEEILGLTEGQSGTVKESLTAHSEPQRKAEKVWPCEHQKYLRAIGLDPMEDAMPCWCGAARPEEKKKLAEFGKPAKCHPALSPYANVYGLERKDCDKCGNYYYENRKLPIQKMELGLDYHNGQLMLKINEIIDVVNALRSEG